MRAGLRRLLDNPCLLRAGGLWEGRRWWRSGLKVQIFAACVLITLELGASVWRWWRWGSVPYENAAELYAIPIPPALLILEGLSFALAAALFFTVLQTADAWLGDRNPENRLHLAATPLKPRDLLLAHSLVWLIIPLGAFALLAALWGAGRTVAALLAPEGSLLDVMTRFDGLRIRDFLNHLSVSWTERLLFWLPDPWVRLCVATSMAMFGLFLCGVTTRVSLRCWSPSSTISLTALMALLFYPGLLIAAGLLERFTTLHFGNRLSILTFVFLYHLAGLLVWRHLPRRVAKAYGMTR